MAVVETQFTGDSERYLRALSTAVNKTAELEGKLRRVGQEGKKASDESSAGWSKAASSLTTYVAGFATLSGALAAATRLWETHIQNLREAGKETEDLTRKSIAFAALQEGGVKAARVQAASSLAVQFGIRDRGVAFDTVQALQSAMGGDFEKGMEAAREVFAATMAGMRLDAAQELAVLGISQRMSAGETLRKAFVTGQLSTREPETIATAAAGLPFFENKDLGFAVGGVLAGSVPKNELETYIKAAGRALEPVPGTEQTKAMQRISGGLSEDDISRMSQMDTLKMLKAEFPGDVKLEDMFGMGIKEIREAQAMMTVLNNFGEVMRFFSEIPRQAADPNLLLKQRAAVEAELPEFRLQREIDVGKARRKEMQAEGLGVQALSSEKRDVARGLAFGALGAEEGLLGMDYIDAEGRMSWFAHMRGILGEGIKDALGDLGILERPEQRFHERFDEEFRRQLRFMETGLRTDAPNPVAGPPVEAIKEPGTTAAQGVWERLDNTVSKLADVAKEWMKAAERMQGTPMRVGRTADQ